MEILQKIYYNLSTGGYYGKMFMNCRYPFFDVCLHYEGNYLCWQHYGSSANKFTIKDLEWVITTIFETTPLEFIQNYELRSSDLKYMDEEKYDRGEVYANDYC